MSDWIMKDKMAFWTMLRDCFTKTTDQDGKDAYEAVKPYGLKAASGAVKQLRDAAKGQAWRIDILRLETVARRLADEELRALDAPRVDAARNEAIARAKGETPQQRAYAEAEQAARETPQAELYAMRDDLLTHYPSLRACYAGKDPRKLRSLALMIFKPAIAQVAQVAAEAEAWQPSARMAS